MNGQYYPFEGMKYLGQNATTEISLVTFTGNTTNGSANIGNVSSYAGLAIGQLIAGPGVPAGAYIVDLDGSSGTITISLPATATTTNPNPATLVAGGITTQNLPLTVHLLQGSIPLNSALLFSQLTEANYDGYLPQAAVGPVIINCPPPRTFAAWQFNRQKYAPTDYTIGNTITGHCLTYTPPGASAPVVVCVETYPTGIPLLQDGDIHTFNPTLSFGLDQTAGVASPGIP